MAERTEKHGFAKQAYDKVRHMLSSILFISLLI